EKSSLLTWPLVLATRITLAYPMATVALAIGLAIAAMGLTYSKLGYRTSRLDLLNPNNDYNRLWIEYINEFGEEDDAVVVVEGPGREQVVPVLQEISTVLAREDQLFHAVLHGVDLEKIRGKGLHFLSPEELRGLERFLGETRPIVEGNWAQLNLTRMVQGMCAHLQLTGADP